MQKIKRFLSVILSVSLAMFLGIAYNQNCNAIKYNDKGVPIDLELRPQCTVEEVVSVLKELQEFVMQKIRSVSREKQFGEYERLRDEFFRSNFGIDREELCINKNRYFVEMWEWKDLFFEKCFEHICNGSNGTLQVFLRYVHALLRKSELESYLIRIGPSGQGMLDAVVVKLGKGWYCISCDELFKFVAPLSYVLYSLYQQNGFKNLYLIIMHTTPYNSYIRVPGVDANSIEGAFRSAQLMEFDHFNRVIDGLKTYK